MLAKATHQLLLISPPTQIKPERIDDERVLARNVFEPIGTSPSTVDLVPDMVRLMPDLTFLSTHFFSSRSGYPSSDALQCLSKASLSARFYGRAASRGEICGKQTTYLRQSKPSQGSIVPPASQYNKYSSPENISVHSFTMVPEHEGPYDHSILYYPVYA